MEYLDSSQPIIFEELTSLQLEKNKPTCHQMIHFEKKQLLIIGTDTGLIYIFDAQALSAKQVQVSNTKIKYVQGDPLGIMNSVVASDGFNYFQINLENFSVTTVNVGPSVEQLFDCTVQGQSASICIQQDGISTIKKQKALFKKQGYEINIQQTIKHAWIGPDHVIYNDTEGLKIYRLSDNTHVKIHHGATHNCIPIHDVLNVNFGLNVMIVTIKDKILLVSLTNKAQDGFEQQVLKARSQTKSNDAILCAIYNAEDAVASCIFGNNLVIVTKTELQIINYFGEVLLIMPLKKQPIDVQAGHMEKLVPYVPKSNLRPKSDCFTIMFKDQIVVCHGLGYVENGLLHLNKLTQYCESAKSDTVDKIVLKDMIQQVTKVFIPLQEDDSAALKLLESVVTMLLNVYLVDEALNLVKQLIDVNKEKNYVNKFIPAFAARGVVNQLLPLVPSPSDADPLPIEIYKQIIDTLLLNDYKLLNQILKLWQVYDQKLMISKIKSVLQIARKSKDEQLDPRHLRLSLIYLLQQQKQFAACYQYLNEFYSQEELVMYCLKNEMHDQLLADLKTFKISQEVKVQTYCQILQRSNFNTEIFIKVISSLLMVQIDSINNMLNAFFTKLLDLEKQKDWISVIPMCRDLSQNDQLRGLYDLLELLFFDEVFAVDSQIITIFLELNQIFRPQDILIMFKRVITLMDRSQTTFKESNLLKLFSDNIIPLMSSQIFVVLQSGDIKTQSTEFYLKRRYYEQFKQNLTQPDQLIFDLLLICFDFLESNRQPEQIQIVRLLSQICKENLSSIVTSQGLNLLHTIGVSVNSITLSTVLKAQFQSTQRASAAIQALKPQLRTLIPLDELLQSHVGIQMLYELKREIQLKHDYLEIIGTGLYKEFSRRERELNRGYLIGKTCYRCRNDASKGVLWWCGHTVCSDCNTCSCEK